MRHTAPEPLEVRGTGRTLAQIKHAAPHSFFMVSNAAMLHYTRLLARDAAHRADLQFIVYQRGWDEKVRGSKCRIVVDHHTASELDEHDMAMIAALNLRPGLEK